jgi:hypothetical protein
LAALGGLASLGLGGGINLNSPQGILSLTGNLLPLLNLLPIDSLIPGNDGKDTTAIISSIPLIISLANSITNFKPDVFINLSYLTFAHIILFNVILILAQQSSASIISMEKSN